MSKFAVIKTGGKQYAVKQGDILKLEKIPAQTGKSFEFKEILLVADENGQKVKVGNPLLKDVKVEADILEQGRDKKIRVVKYKPKTRYHKVYGHRQPFTKVKINKIT